MVVSRTTETMHDATSAPLSTLVLDSAWAVKECRAGADQCKTGVSLRRSRAVGSILFDKRVHSELGCVQRAVEVDFNCLQIGRLRRIFWTCRLWH